MNTTQSVRIKVRGRLSGRLATVFEDMTIVHGVDGSELVGEISDQAQLHGLLTRIRDLGIELEAVTIAAHQSRESVG
jgi:hypothetical protein